ncbi:MAG: hypothetical protein AAGG01_16360 [Planctomycetota bacterium]
MIRTRSLSALFILLASPLLASASSELGALAVEAAPAALAFDECDECTRGKICKSHRASDRSALKRLAADLASKDAEVRIRALRDVGALAAEHDVAPGKEAAEVLAAALEDDQLVVQVVAMKELTNGQHPEVAVTAVVKKLKWFKGHMWTLVEDMTGSNEEHGTVGQAMEMLEVSVRNAKDLRDDRIVDALGGLLLAFPTEMRGEQVAMAATRSLIYLGTPKAVKTVIKQLGSFNNDAKMRQVHLALRTLANRLDVEDSPEFSKKAEADWSAWLRKHQRKMPKKLGKWTGPPPLEDEDEDETEAEAE